MRIELSNEPTLSTLHKLSMSWKRFSREDKNIVMNSVFFKAEEQYRCRKAEEYCNHNGIEYSELESAKKELQEFDYRAYDSIIRTFNVELISSSFEEETCRSIPKLFETLDGKCIYDIVGKSNGILILKDTITLYYIAKEGSFFETLSRYNNQEKGTYSYQFGEKRFMTLHTKSGEKEVCYFAILPVMVLLFMKISQVRTQQIASNTLRESLDTIGEDKVINNKTPFRITQIDSTWYTTYVREESFMVRGFWRKQACGRKHSEHKWVYIQPFEKKGYRRRAKKLMQEAA